MVRESFIFYRSFYEALKDLEGKDFEIVIKAICEYALNEKEIDLDGLPKALFTLIKPQIDANNERRINGCKGGRPKKTNGYDTKKPTVMNNETNGYDTKKPNDNDNENVNVNVNDNDNENVNEKEENSLTTIKEYESSSSYLSVFIDLYQIESDISSLTVVRSLDFKKVMQAFNKSSWLRTEIKSLRWVVNNYQKIINGAYDDKPKKPREEENGWVKAEWNGVVEEEQEWTDDDPF
jgi:hypothetical protein